MDKTWLIPGVPCSLTWSTKTTAKSTVQPTHRTYETCMNICLRHSLNDYDGVRVYIFKLYYNA